MSREELSMYAELDGTEIGDYFSSLAAMRSHNVDYGMTDEFSAALDKEIADRLAWIKGATRIIEETITPKPVKVKDLEWLE